MTSHGLGGDSARDGVTEGIDCPLGPSERLSVIVIEPGEPTTPRHRGTRGLLSRLLIKSQPLHALSTGLSTQLRNTRPNRLHWTSHGGSNRPTRPAPNPPEPH